MKIKITCAVFIALMVGTAVVQAQQWGDRSRLMNAIDKTDELITRAREAVQESGSERARNQLAMAVQLQKMAQEMARSAVIDFEMYAPQAGKYTLSAREKAQRAIAITLQATENEDYVRRRLESTDDLIRKVEDRVGDGAPGGLRLLLDSSREKQQRAVELFRNRRLRASLQLTLQVEKSLKKAADKAGSYRKAQDRYQTQLERYFALMERIDLAGHENRPEVERAVEKAERLRAQAEELAVDAGRYVRAENTIQQAVEILTRVDENLREPAKVKIAIEDTRKLAERVESQVESFGDDQINRQYLNSQKHLDKAVEFYDRGDYGGAAAQIQAARQILTRIAELIEKPILIEHGLEFVKGLAAGLKGKVDDSGDQALQNEYAQAQSHLVKASAFHRAGDYDAASAQLEMAERILARIAHSLGE